MVVNGLTLPPSFRALIEGHPHTVWNMTGNLDAYGLPLINGYGRPYRIQFSPYHTLEEIQKITTVMSRDFGRWANPSSFLDPEMRKIAKADLEAERPGFLAPITDYSRIVQFGCSPPLAPFCFDFRESIEEPSVIHMPMGEIRWRRIAPNFEAFIRLFDGPVEDDPVVRAREERQRRLEKHRRLTRELLAETSDDDLAGAVMDYVVNEIGDNWGRDDEIVSRLPRSIQLVFAMCFIRNSINRDGFQPLLEWDSPYAPLAAEGYRLVGATERAAVMERAAEVIHRTRAKHPGHPYPQSRALGTLDSKFYALNQTDNLDQLIVSYIRARQEEFVAG